MELLLVIVLAGVLAVVATVALSTSVTSFKLNGAATKMSADIRYAKQQARAKNGWYGVRFRANPVNRYNVYYTDGVSDIDVLDPLDPSRVLDVDLFSEFGGVVISNVDLGLFNNKVEFNPMGVPYRDMLLWPLPSNGTITLSYGGSTSTIRIMQSTGMVEVITVPGCSLLRPEVSRCLDGVGRR